MEEGILVQVLVPMSANESFHEYIMHGLARRDSAFHAQHTIDKPIKSSRTPAKLQCDIEDLRTLIIGKVSASDTPPRVSALISLPLAHGP